jgi:FAD/FMN-containing dehydrogenase
MHGMAAPAVQNWFGDLVSHPRVVVEAKSARGIARILRDPHRYPSPVRAVGSNHSTAPCGAADGGTVIRMRGMNRILEITDEHVTAEAGAMLIDVAHELRRRGLQFYVNTEIGNLTLGSAACAGTKDGSMPGEYGQVSSYCTRMKLVLPSGKVLEVDEEREPELMALFRSSYGTCGIVTQATFRIRRIQPMEVFHETFLVRDFTRRLPELLGRGYSMMYYMFLFDGWVTVEFRRYNPRAKGPPDEHVWALRNQLWAEAGPRSCAQAERDIENRFVRYKVIDGFGALWRFKLEHLVRSKHSIATDQIIRYPEVSDDSRYTFSLWAFPEETFADVLAEYTRWVKAYEKTRRYRTNMLHVGYRITADRQSLLSYSWDGNVMTIDPVSTANPGWKQFLADFNTWCSDRGGTPLPNQTWGFTRAQAQQALGERLETLAARRAEFDPDERLLNDFFRELFGVSARRRTGRAASPQRARKRQAGRPTDTR